MIKHHSNSEQTLGYRVKVTVPDFSDFKKYVQEVDDRVGATKLIIKRTPKVVER